MLPKYNELDLTPFFAPFFMLFFGLCLGDSGYGLFMVLGVTVYRMLAKNVGASMKPILTLVQILGASTFFCGMLTGTFSDLICMVMIFRSLIRCVICSSWTINGCLIFH